MMKAGKFLVLAIALMLLIPAAVPCRAADTKDDSFWTDDEGAKPADKRPDLREEAIKNMLDSLKEANPTKAAELEKLRDTDPEKFRVELRKAMREEFGKKIKEPKGDRKPGGPNVPPPPDMQGKPGDNGKLVEKQAEYLKWLEKNFPERAEKLTQLKEEHSTLYPRYLMLGYKRYQRIMEAEKENPELAKALIKNMELKRDRDKLIGKIKETTDAEAKKVLTKQLEQVVSQRFDVIVKLKQMEYEQLRADLKKLEKRVSENEAEVQKWKDPTFKETNVKKHMEELLEGNKAFSWD